jgi:MoxR-like ATPase
VSRTAAAPGLLPAHIDDPNALREHLRELGYLADDGLATAAYLALRLHRPLFLEGDPGVGKTAVGSTLALLLGAPLIRLQCYEGIDASQALYDWDFPRQVLHLRAAEAAGQAAGADIADLETDLYDRRFLLARPLLAALEQTPSVLLIDEVDRADDEFESFLLEVLREYRVSIPELGVVAATVPPAVVITSNRTREVHDALKRRCLYHWIDHPDFDREVAIVRTRLPDVSARLAAQVTGAVQSLRDEDLFKPPGVAETLDWTEALHTLGATELDEHLVTATLGSVLKYREDQERARALDMGRLVREAVEGA